MKKNVESTKRRTPKPSRGRGLAALLSGRAIADKELPEELRAELHRMSKGAMELLFQHMDYDEARAVMRHGWPSRYFAHIAQIAKKAKL